MAVFHRMKSYTRAFAATLVTCTVLVIIYSTVNLEEADTHRGLPNIPVKPFTKPVGLRVRLATVDAKANHIHLPDVKILAIQISPGFRSAIPHNSAFWNRKLHSGFRNADEAGNLTQSEINGNSTLESIESLQTNIPDFNTYPPLYQDFLRSMHFRSPDLLTNQPHKCISNGKPDQVTLLLGIKSVPRNFEERQAVRETWGQERVYEDGLLVRRVFLLGTPSLDDPDLRQLLSLEGQQFGDLLVWDFKDSFYNLTLKEHVFIKWSIQHCPHATFIFKGDDDVFVNTKAILKYLKSLEPDKITKLYLGQIISQASPHRDPKIKYYVPPTFYDGPYLPYAGGGGFVFSGALLEPLYSISWHIPFYPIDDVYAGMCFHALGISPQKHSGFQTFDIREQDRQNPCVHRDLLVVHRRSPQQAVRLWRSMESRWLTC